MIIDCSNCGKGISKEEYLYFAGLCSKCSQRDRPTLKEEKMTERTYTLTCDRCGEWFESPDGFPSPQVCFKCAKPKEETMDMREKVKRILVAWGNHRVFCFEDEPEPDVEKYVRGICQLFEQERVNLLNEIEIRFIEVGGPPFPKSLGISKLSWRAIRSGTYEKLDN